MRKPNVKKIWNLFSKFDKEKKSVKKEEISKKYHNEVKLELNNSTENDEFLIESAIAFVKLIGATEESIDVVKRMVKEELADFRENNPDEKIIIFKMEIDDRIFYVESDKVKKDF